MKKEKGKVKFYVYTIQGIKLTFDRVLYILKLFNFTAAGFGLRVVGGKTGTDGRTFAYVMWTLPDGPAAKVGIQRGDKVRISSIFFFSLENLFWLCWHFLLVKRILSFFLLLPYSTRISSRETGTEFGNWHRNCFGRARLDLFGWNKKCVAPIEAGNILQAVNACEYRQPFSPAVILIKLSTAAPNANAPQ